MSSGCAWDQCDPCHIHVQPLLVADNRMAETTQSGVAPCNTQIDQRCHAQKAAKEFQYIA